MKLEQSTDKGRQTTRYLQSCRAARRKFLPFRGRLRSGLHNGRLPAELRLREGVPPPWRLARSVQDDRDGWLLGHGFDGLRDRAICLEENSLVFRPEIYRFLGLFPRIRVVGLAIKYEI